MQHQKGQSLLEALVVLAILSSVAVTGINVIESVKRRVALRAATSDLRAGFHYVRSLAVARDRNVAIRFRGDGNAWTWAVYEDGDGDGVRNDDISKQIDRELQMPRRFQHAAAGIGLPAGSIPDPMNGGKLADRPPVRFNASMLCSFSRLGEVTNGSVVISDGIDAVIVQSHGRSGRVSVLQWNGKKWTTGV